MSDMAERLNKEHAGNRIMNVDKVRKRIVRENFVIFRYSPYLSGTAPIGDKTRKITLSPIYYK